MKEKFNKEKSNQNFGNEKPNKSYKNSGKSFINKLDQVEERVSVLENKADEYTIQT
jgi:hypothetical protein